MRAGCSNAGYDSDDSDASDLSAESEGGTIDWEVPLKLPRSVLLAAKQAQAAQEAATHSVRRRLAAPPPRRMQGLHRPCRPPPLPSAALGPSVAATKPRPPSGHRVANSRFCAADFRDGSGGNCGMR